MLARLLLVAISCLALLDTAMTATAAKQQQQQLFRHKNPAHYNYHTILQQKYDLGLLQRPAASGNVTEWQIEQPLDHYDRTNKLTYNQTYWTNDQFFDPSNPVGFIFLGGEWQEDASTLEYGANAMTGWAKMYSGFMVDIQHRYYNGVPAADEGDAEQVKYLSSVQSLADAARVIEHINAMYAPKLQSPIKWISMGGSYAGNMAAWFRLRYPELTVGSFAISGPVEAVVDYTGFFAVEGHDLDPACLKTTRAAVAEFDSYLSDKGKGWDKIKSDFNVEFSNELDLGTWIFTELAWNTFSTGEICTINNATATPYENLVALLGGNQKVTYNYTAEQVWSTYSWLWYRQTCGEMGYYQTGTDFDTNPLQPVSKFLNPSLFLAACRDAYGFTAEETEENIRWTNVAYGGKNITTTNTFFTHGNADGWSAAGVTSGPVPITGNQVFVIDGGTHCSDLYWPSDDDSASLKAARQKQIDQIKIWLSA